MNSNSDAEALSQNIIQIIRENKPSNVNQLVILLKDRLQLTEKQALASILEMQSQGKIKLENHPLPTPLDISSYIKTSPLWYWAAMATAMLTVVVVFTIPESLLPWSYVRNALGTIFVLWLPGYTFIKALFPVNVPIKTSTENLDIVERIALSLGMSLALVPLVGFILNYTPWGVRLAPIVLTLFILTCVFATVALIRERQIEKANLNNSVTLYGR